MSLVNKIVHIKRKRHDGQYAWGHADALSEAAELAKAADETIADILAACKAIDIALCIGNRDELIAAAVLARAAISKAEQA